MSSSRPPRTASSHTLRLVLARLRIPPVDQRTGGLVLLIATVVALVWANLAGDGPWSYDRVFHTTWTVAPLDALGLHLTFSEWISDGLLAVFFFLAGYEVKREFTRGSLASPRRAVLPVAAATAGVVVPALVYLAVVALSGAGGVAPRLWHGWATPTATDIAFALAVLAVAGSRLPGAARTFLLTLAVVDDLIAIVVIAAVYSGPVHLPSLGAAVLVVGAFAVVVRASGRVPGRVLGRVPGRGAGRVPGRGTGRVPGRGTVPEASAGRRLPSRITLPSRILVRCALVALAILAWYLVHDSGVHATVAGVALAATVPTRGARGDRAERTVHALAPFSDLIVLPLFALSAAGVRFLGAGVPEAPGQDAVLWAVFAGLVLGKPVGILVGTWVTLRATGRRLRRDLGLAWSDLVALGLVGGIGFTVALLVAGLALPPALAAHARLGVLLGSATSAVVGGAALMWRNAYWSRVGRVHPPAG